MREWQRLGESDKVGDVVFFRKIIDARFSELADSVGRLRRAEESSEGFAARSFLRSQARHGGRQRRECIIYLIIVLLLSMKCNINHNFNITYQ